MALRVHRIPHSTNVDRIALACGHKGVAVEWVDHDPDDRSAIVAVSGQPYAPVAEFADGTVLSDSAVILRKLEEVDPYPALWPADPAQAALAEIVIEWFNELWKLPPNAIADGVGSPMDATLLRQRSARIAGLLADGRDYLLGPELTIADVVVQPFAAYFGAELAQDDDHRFHVVLAALPADDHVRAWVARVNEIPRA